MVFTLHSSQDELSRHIIELQHERFFELLTAKYWNNSLKGYCPNADESEGITLESLGGVFIATLFGLGLAMLTLIGEVIYYRRIRKPENDGITRVTPIDTTGISTPPALTSKVHPSPPPYAETIKSLSYPKASSGLVTIGNTFEPTKRNRQKNKYTLDQLFSKSIPNTEYLE